MAKNKKLRNDQMDDVDARPDVVESNEMCENDRRSMRRVI